MDPRETGLEYRHDGFGLRNKVEKFFRYLKERTMVFYHMPSVKDYIQGIMNLKLFLNPILPSRKNRR